MSALTDRIVQAQAKIVGELTALASDVQKIEKDIQDQANGVAQQQIAATLANAQDLVASTKAQADQTISLARQEFQLELATALAKQKADLTAKAAAMAGPKK